MTDPQSPRDNSENNPEISQSIFSNVNAEKIQTRDITQTINNFQPRLRPTGIPQNIPFRGTTHFVGRLEQLDTLHRELQRTDRVAISAVAGMGGIGKTELGTKTSSGVSRRCVLVTGAAWGPRGSACGVCTTVFGAVRAADNAQ